VDGAVRVEEWDGRVETFGEAMLRLRGAMSLRELARRAFLNAGHLSRIQAGRRRPTAAMAATLDRVLAGDGVLVALAARDPAGPLEGGRWDGVDSQALAAALLAEAPTAANAARIAHAWLVAEPPQVGAVRSGRCVGTAMVAEVTHRVHQLRLLDDHLGGLDTDQVVRAELAATATLVREAAYTEPVGRALLAAVGELCQIAGWVSHDAGDYPRARGLYLAGVHAAHAGGDRVGAANNLSCLSYLVADIGDPREAVLLARSALLGTEQVATPAVRALLAERVAWAHARAGQPDAAERALDQAHHSLADRQPDEPVWTYWLSDQEAQIMAGRVWTQLRRPLRAVPILDRAIAGYGEDTGRETALYLTWHAEALLQAHEIDQAAHTAQRALSLSGMAGSVRARRRVRTLIEAMRPHHRLPAVADLHAAYGDLGDP
jgi:transcriptional regulator with XRE-family HTH domain